MVSMRQNPCRRFWRAMRPLSAVFLIINIIIVIISIISCISKPKQHLIHSFTMTELIRLSNDFPLVQFPLSSDHLLVLIASRRQVASFHCHVTAKYTSIDSFIVIRCSLSHRWKSRQYIAARNVEFYILSFTLIVSLRRIYNGRTLSLSVNVLLENFIVGCYSR